MLSLIPSETKKKTFSGTSEMRDFSGPEHERDRYTIYLAKKKEIKVSSLIK